MRILASGLGGGLDVVNASLIYFAAKNEGRKVNLGAVHPVSLDKLADHSRFADSGTVIDENSRVLVHGRYIEPAVSHHIKEKVYYFSVKHDGKKNIALLREAIATQLGIRFTHAVFVDGGGDSLQLKPGDKGETSESDNPFYGGDAKVLEALSGIPNTYLAVVSAGLDVNEQRFQQNIELLRQRNAYFGRVNLVSRKKEDYQLDDILKFSNGFLNKYFDLAEKVLVLSPEDFNKAGKEKSHTAVVTYHAMKGNFGLQRTYVDWEPEVNGKRGVIVTPEHRWMYFFDAGKIHEVKKELNS
jgi:hypothetical protein